AAVVLASEDRPLPALELAEVLATSDVPGGVVNILTGHIDEVSPHLASHMDIRGIDLAGAANWGKLEAAAAETITRVRRPAPEQAWHSDQSIERIRAITETKTVWHPKGL